VKEILIRFIDTKVVPLNIQLGHDDGMTATEALIVLEGAAKVIRDGLNGVAKARGYDSAKECGHITKTIQLGTALDCTKHCKI
jgi:hypothetical protein